MLLKQYEDEKANWQSTRQSLEDRLGVQQGAILERVPFDPFGEAPLLVLNAVKSDCKTRDKQVEILQTLKGIVDPTAASSLAQGFD